MISPVHNFIKNFADAGADIITIHPEATNDLVSSIKKIKGRGLMLGIEFPYKLKNLEKNYSNIKKIAE